VVAIGEYLVLAWQMRAAGIDEVDAGRRFACAISCARRCFLTVSGEVSAALTVASLAITTQVTAQHPADAVMMPAAATWLVVHVPRRERRESSHGDRISSA